MARREIGGGHMNRLPEQEHRRRLELYNQGLIDREIAARVFVTPEAITAWRRVHRLPPHSQYRVITREMDHEMRRLHRDGLNDVEIGRKMGLVKNTVFSWRRRKGLPSNYDHRGAASQC